MQSEKTYKLKEASAFSVVDLKEGFRNIQLDEDSQKLCTFSTPFGNYQFNRLPYGLCVSTEVFQKFCCETFGDIPNVVVMIDDLLIHGKTIAEHDTALKAILERAKLKHLRFNPDKFQFRVPQVKYYGHVFSKEGMFIDDDRINAIKALKDPHDKKSLQKFLGTINYVRQFIPNLSKLTAPLRELLKKGIIFRWSETHSKAISIIKKHLMSSMVLKSFNPDKQIVIQTDASQHGLGACLMQENCPVSYASRRLSDTEERYAQVEKEFLAITFACKKFHYFIYGRDIEIKTDHKPLISIMKKEIHKIPSAKLQRMRLRLLNYNLKVEYVPGKYLHIADYLSRNFIETGNEQEDRVISESVLSLSISNKREEQFKTETESDENFKTILKYCHEGWPGDISKVPNQIKEYFKLRNDILSENGILYFNDRIMVPISLRSMLLNMLHESHMGINKTRKRARELFYWPGMNVDIENSVQNCPKCIFYSNSNMREPMIPHSIPDLPFNKVSCDILELKGNSYLVLMG